MEEAAEDTVEAPSGTSVSGGGASTPGRGRSSSGSEKIDWDVTESSTYLRSEVEVESFNNEMFSKKQHYSD